MAGVPLEGQQITPLAQLMLNANRQTESLINNLYEGYHGVPPPTQPQHIWRRTEPIVETIVHLVTDMEPPPPPYSSRSGGPDNYLAPSNSYPLLSYPSAPTMTQSHSWSTYVADEMQQ